MLSFSVILSLLLSICSCFIVVDIGDAVQTAGANSFNVTTPSLKGNFTDTVLIVTWYQLAAYCNAVMSVSVHCFAVNNQNYVYSPPYTFYSTGKEQILTCSYYSDDFLTYQLGATFNFNAYYVCYNTFGIEKAYYYSKDDYKDGFKYPENTSRNETYTITQYTANLGMISPKNHTIIF